MSDFNLPMSSELEKYLMTCDNTTEAWNSKLGKNYLTDANELFISGLSDWIIFLTLTFREDKPPDSAKKLFHYLVRILNEDVYGKKFYKFIKHSYFSYVLALEYQKREVVHFHVLIDKPINFKLTHSFWNYRAGFVVTNIIKYKDHAIRYVSKYTLKGGDHDFFVSEYNKLPKVFPWWWRLDKFYQPGLLELDPESLTDKNTGRLSGQS